MSPYGPYDPDWYMNRGDMEFGTGRADFPCAGAAHWSDRSPETERDWAELNKALSSSCTALVPVRKTDDNPDFTPVKTPQVCSVEFEDLGEDLLDGVTTKTIKEVKEFSPPIYRGRGFNPSPSFSFGKEVEDTTQDPDGNHTLKVDGFLSEQDMPRWGQGVWSLFHLNGLSLLDSHFCRVMSGSQKYMKATQTYKVAVTNKDTVPYIQLLCNAKRVKYLGAWFKDGDVITLFVRHHFMPTLPSPPIISIQPRAEQTFVPLLPKQRLQIITDASKADLEFRFGADSALLYEGRQEIDRERASRLGSNVRCDFFECVRPAEQQELVFINGKMLGEKFKTISVPVLSRATKDKRYPVIIDPVRTSVLVANNIDGFILRSNRKIDLRVDQGVGVKPIYSMEKEDYNETKVSITSKQQPFFVLERVNNQWVVKSH